MVTLSVARGYPSANELFGQIASSQGGINAAVGDANIAAAVNVHSIAVGINLKIVDRQIVDPSREDSEPARSQHGKIAQDHIAAILQGNSFVAYTGLAGARQVLIAFVPATQPFSPDEAGTENRDITNVFSPDQAVVPVVVPVILIGLPSALRLGRVVASAGVPSSGVEAARMVAPGSKYRHTKLFR